MKKHLNTYIENDGFESFITVTHLFELSNKLAETCVMNIYSRLEKMGVVKLGWDDKLNDFVYIPVKDNY